tara:strand:+ start:356 stop:811 length:456 start_codon:yes stop_codon:yes gene_type:complete
MILYQYKAKVRRVIDGDSIVCDIDLGFGIILKERNVRLFGIDTCEIRSKNLAEKQFGKLAKEFVRRQLPRGFDVILSTHLDKNDKFGRILAEVIMPSGDALTNRIIDERWGVRYFGRSKKEIREAHRKNWLYHRDRGNLINPNVPDIFTDG